MVNVTKANFPEKAEEIRRLLPDATFVAIDLEMSGISTPESGRLPNHEDPEHRYERIRAVPERYSIVEFGLVLFHENEEYVQHIRDKEKKGGRSEGACSKQTGGIVREEESGGNSGEESGDESDSLEESSSDSEATRRKDPPEFLVRKYNFFLFPPVGMGYMGNDENTRELVLNPAAIAFLKEHKFQFNLWMKEGVPFVTGDVARALEVKFEEKYRKREEEEMKKDKAKRERTSSSFTNIVVPKPTRPDHVQYVAREMASLREWIDSALPRSVRANLDSDEEDMAELDDELISHSLPVCKNDYLRNCLCETIAAEYPTLILECPTRPDKDPIRVFRLNPKEKKIRDARLKKEDWAALQCDHIGFYSVFEALSKANRGRTTKGNRCVPMIVHNGLMDLLFLITHFHSRSLPESFVGAKKIIHELFPVIYDTKVMAYDCDFGVDIQRSETKLEDLYKLCARPRSDDSDSDDDIDDDDSNDGTGGEESATVRVLHDISRIFDEEEDEEEEEMHHAGNDAFKTGCVFHTLSRRVIMRKKHDALLEIAGEGAGDNSSERSKTVRLAEFLQIKLECDNESNARERKLVSFCKEQLKRNMISMSELYTINLGSHSDVLSHGRSPDSCYCVSKIDPCVKTHDIRAALKFHEVASDKRPSVKIIWIDNQSLIVATDPPLAMSHGIKSSEQGMSVDNLECRGKLVKAALLRRFPTQRIISLRELWEEATKGQEQESSNTSTMVTHGAGSIGDGFWALGTAVAKSVIDIIGRGLQKRGRSLSEEQGGGSDTALRKSKRQRALG